MKNHYLSIIIPVYNTKNFFLSKCFDSIKNQTFKNYEVIIVDSSDSNETTNYLLNVARTSNFLYIRSSRNVSMQRNLGLDNAKGDLIAFIDSDDYIDKNYFEKLIVLIDKGCDVACGVVVRETYDESKKINSKKLPFLKGIINVTKNNYFSSIKKYPLVHPVKLYKKSIICTKFDPSLAYGEDLIFNYNLSKNGFKIGFSNETIYHYTCEKNENAISKRFHQSTFNILDRLVKIYKNDNLLSAERESFLDRYSFIFLNVYFVCVKKLKLLRCLKLYRFRFFYFKHFKSFSNFVYMFFPFVYYVVGKMKRSF